ncbi:splicing factor U2AF 50 kDa subunit [Drosophila pseudoobscura]|uniref:Splicing factor U2AF subunit n=1 Tax=Drosophila pseudoobscura pseudoobscura TaxID=46245 RepID=A0A6I8UT76_DROPS|nr:splicing factor U2AF 50 kDa subunit [Drosophila pseudoobscura]
MGGGRKTEKRLSHRNRSGSKSEQAVSCYTRPRSRNRSRSKDRSRSHSRSRSRSRATRSSAMARKSLTKRRRHGPSLWDVPPEGYAHVTPMQYKAMQASGQITARIQSDTQPTADTAAIAMVTRQARRLYVGNIPFGVTEDDIMAFFNQQFLLLGDNCGGQLCLDGKAVLSCQANLDKNFAFIEFRSMQEATQATTFDGISFRGQVLKIRRPHDYHPVGSVGAAAGAGSIPDAVGGCASSAAAKSRLSSAETGSLGSQAISNLVPDSPHKIYIGGLPTCLNETQIKELLLSFGQLRGFNLVKDPSTTLSKGYAFFEYVDPLLTEQVIANLNGMQLGDRRLIVQRSIPSGRYAGNQQIPIQVPGLVATSLTGSTAGLNNATQVLCLLNMVLPEELLDNEEYEDIRADIEQECSKYGEVLSLKIPRPQVSGGEGEGEGGGDSATRPKGCGKVYVHFGSIEDSEKALGALSGRKFSGRIVIGSFFDRDKYLSEDF